MAKTIGQITSTATADPSGQARPIASGAHITTTTKVLNVREPVPRAEASGTQISAMPTTIGPRWVPLTLAGFLAVEFIGSSLSDWASSVAAALYVVLFGALAVMVWRRRCRLDEPARLGPDGAGAGRPVNVAP